jgi:hypothetical protein
MVDLTKDEQRFAEASVKQRHQVVCRHRSGIFWVGLVFVLLGYPIVSLPDWVHSILRDVGFFLLVLAGMGLTMSTTGKLYEYAQRLEGRRE